MAKDTAKIKLSKTAGRVAAGAVPDDDDDETETEPVSDTTPTTTLPSLQEDVVVETPSQTAAALNSSIDDEQKFVTLAVHRELDPAPVVGGFRFSDHGITKLTEGMRIRVPYFVAIHMVDKNVGSITSVV